MSIRTRYWAFVAAAVAACVAAGGAIAQSPPLAQAVTVDSVGTVKGTYGVYEKPAVKEEVAPFATVLLLPGGNGLLGLDANGLMTSGTGQFLNRSAAEFMRRGVNVMIPDITAAFPSGMTFTDRLGATHASQIQTWINTATALFGRPVWVVGAAHGGISAVTAGGFLPALTGYAGIILPSPTTNLSNNPTNQTNWNTYVSRITAKPVLLQWHQSDTCSFTPTAGAVSLNGALPTSDKVGLSYTGGHAVAADPCNSGFAEQSFTGFEGTVVNDIVNFIKQRTPPSQVANQASPAPQVGSPVRNGWRRSTHRN